MQSINKKCDCVLLYVCCRVYIHPYFSVPIQAPLGDATAQGGLQVEPPPQCCACGEARYKMHFQGLWSRQTHPKGFPIEDGKFQLLSPGRPNPRETIVDNIGLDFLVLADPPKRYPIDDSRDQFLRQVNHRG